MLFSANAWRGSRYRKSLFLALPLIGSNLAQSIKHLTDTVMMGWYGVTELAAVVLAASLWSIVFIVGAGIGMAVVPLAAGAQGRAQTWQVRRLVRMGCWLSLCYCMVAFPLFIFGEPIFLQLRQEPEVAFLAGSYLKIAVWALVPALVVMTLKAFFLALVRPQIILWSTISGAILNVFVNYALIFGNWGAPELGVSGAAIATVFSHTFSLVVMLLYIAMVRSFRTYRLLSNVWRPHWSSLKEVLFLGAPISITLIAETTLFGCSAVLMGWIDTATLAAHGIVIEIAAFVFMIYLGLANAATTEVSLAVGQADLKEVRAAARAVQHLTLATVALVVIVLIAFSSTLISAFLDADAGDAAEVLRIGVTLMYFCAFFQLADAMQVVVLGLLRGLGDTRGPMIIAAFSYSLVGLPISYFLGFTLGLGGPGVWTGLIVGLGLAAVLFSWRFRKRLAALSL
ncbi:MAG: MATE family efflux transporter [Rhodobacteraceae bacterium]|nr:MATE family efflux transporter [Paracoccaceae bacterium]